MDYVIKIMTPAERSYCYTGSQQLDKQAGCIGHLRGDMDRRGNGFFTSWEDHCGELKTQAFKDEFDDFINLSCGFFIFKRKGGLICQE